MLKNDPKPCLVESGKKKKKKKDQIEALSQSEQHSVKELFLSVPLGV